MSSIPGIKEIHAASILSTLHRGQTPEAQPSWTTMDAEAQATGKPKVNVDVKPGTEFHYYHYAPETDNSSSCNSSRSSSSVDTDNHSLTTTASAHASPLSVNFEHGNSPLSLPPLASVHASPPSVDFGREGPPPTLPSLASVIATSYAIPPLALPPGADSSRYIRTLRTRMKDGRTPGVLLTGLHQATADSTYREVMHFLGPRFGAVLDVALKAPSRGTTTRTKDRYRRHARLRRAFKLAHGRLEPIIVVYLLASYGVSGLDRLPKLGLRDLNAYFKTALVKICPMLALYGQMAFGQYAEKINKILHLVKGSPSPQQDHEDEEEDGNVDYEGYDPNDLHDPFHQNSISIDQGSAEWTTTRGSTAAAAANDAPSHMSSPPAALELDFGASRMNEPMTTLPANNDELEAMIVKFNSAFG